MITLLLSLLSLVTPLVFVILLKETALDMYKHHDAKIWVFKNAGLLRVFAKQVTYYT